MTEVTQFLTPLVNVPSLAAPRLFESRAENLWNTQVPSLIGEFNTAIGQFNTVAGEVNANALAVAINTALADGYRAQAAASAAAAAGSSGASLYNNGQPYSQYAVARSAQDYQVYVRKTAGTGGGDPSTNLAAWTRITGPNIGIGAATSTGSIVLTVNSVGVQSVSPTYFGQSVTLPSATTLVGLTGINLYALANGGDYPMAIINAAGTVLGYIAPKRTVQVSLVDTSTAAGVWVLHNHEWAAQTASFTATLSAAIGAAREFVTLTVDGIEVILLLGATNLEAIAYNPATGAVGAQVTVRASKNYTKQRLLATRNAANQCLIVAGDNSNEMMAIVLSLSGVTLTPNTLRTWTSGTSGGITLGSMEDGYKIVQAGSTFVFGMLVNGNSKVQALTISGSSPTIACSEGTEQALASTQHTAPLVELVTASTVMYHSLGTSSAISAATASVSGNTLTPGSNTTITATAQTSTNYIFRKVGSRWLVVYNNATVLAGAVINVSGTATTHTTVPLAAFAAAADGVVVAQFADRLLVAAFNGTSFACNCLVDNAGTAQAGTAATGTIGSGGIRYVRESSTELQVAFKSAQDGVVVAKIGYSGNNPVINDYQAANDETFGTTQRIMATTSDPNMLVGRDYSGNLLYTDQTAFNTVAAQNCMLSTGKSLLRAPRVAMRGSVFRKSANERWVLNTVFSGSNQITVTRFAAAA